MNKTRQVILAALATGFTLTAIAEEQSPIIVTATRTAQTVDESLASVTVISKEQIAQQQANNLLELLSSVSGIDMTNNGGMGKTTSMFMRGTSSSHVLVMIDGIKVGSATSGSTAFEHIPVAQIERIEIVRGPRAALYGSEAIGGVIQIFTKKANSTTQRYVELGLGTNATQSATAGITGKIGSTSYAVNVNQLSTDGINVQDDITTNNDKDGYENTSLSLNLSHQFSKTSSLQLNAMHAFGNNKYDNIYSADNVSNYAGNFVQQTTGIQYTVAALANWNIKLNAAQGVDKTETVVNAVSKSEFNTTRDTLSWQNDINIGTNQILTLGADYQNDQIESTTAYNETSRHNTAAFIQHQWNGTDNDLQLALRNDNNETFGLHTTGNIAWGHNFTKTMRLIASYGTAFKAPTFNDLYWPDTGFGGGDPTLKPEESKSTEIELRTTHTWGKLSVSAYNTQIDNLISGWPPTNVNKAEINGVEIRLKTKVAGWNTKAEISLLDPRDKISNNILARRTQASFRVDMDKTVGKWSTGLTYINQDYRFDDADNLDRLDGYSVINLRASYAISKKTSVKWKIENILDTDYETTLGYNNPGISGYISILYQGF